jgi:hypothetical protein
MRRSNAVVMVVRDSIGNHQPTPLLPSSCSFSPNGRPRRVHKMTSSLLDPAGRHGAGIVAEAAGRGGKLSVPYGNRTA